MPLKVKMYKSEMCRGKGQVWFNSQDMITPVLLKVRVIESIDVAQQ